MENILNRIEKIAHNEGITITALEKKIGASKGVLSRAIANDTDIQYKWVQIIVENYPLYSTEWLITGKGEMLKSDTQKQDQRKLIPVYSDVSTIGGVNESIAGMESVTQPSEWIDGGDWFSDATSAIHHYGDSMIEYPSGCILALKRITDIQMIIWGKNYVIETDEYRITKKLQRGLSEGYIRAYSTNEETYRDGTLIHQPIDILLSSIRRLELVLGYVVKEQSSGKIYNIINRRT
jgi:hypothetical protein